MRHTIFYTWILLKEYNISFSFPCLSFISVPYMLMENLKKIQY